MLRRLAGKARKIRNIKLAHLWCGHERLKPNPGTTVHNAIANTVVNGLRAVQLAGWNGRDAVPYIHICYLTEFIRHKMEIPILSRYC